MKKIYESMSRKEDVIFTGRLDQKRLAEVLASALALCYVSYFEGFGIPLVEAMRAGTPVLAANATSLPEVGSDAVLYVDPFNIEDIVNGLKRLVSESELRNDLTKKGLERAKEFDWQKTADGMWETILRTVDRN